MSQHKYAFRIQVTESGEVLRQGQTPADTLAFVLKHYDSGNLLELTITDETDGFRFTDTEWCQEFTNPDSETLRPEYL